MQSSPQGPPNVVAPGARRGDARLRARYGPWAVVTGASDGIGRELATRLAAAGVHVVLVARRQDALEALSRDLRERFAVTTRVIALDLARPASAAELATRTLDLDVGLFVAAAGFGTSGPFVDGELDAELAMVDVNCRAVVAQAHHFASRLAARGSGGIVLMSSLLAFQGVARAACYAATKAFVQSFAEGLGRELGPRGVDVLACAPGPVHSGFAARADMRLSLGATPRAVGEATLRALGRRRVVRPGWLAKALEWSLALLPRWGRVRVMSRVMSTMTGHKRVPAAAARAAP